ncbi:hypothetical protein QBC47DRAFT_165161 [Echria macrotheca]|uniref:SMODS and SLOG-associating 2TM effector domain-containing protein n=1 Tax=Echria macrotheca TaxID=438768 RepID=A0AAJ0FBY1_9PEZI|nr:hypothetical protein QBC47DRAFT_165161 [Echria macrotheca]
MASFVHSLLRMIGSKPRYGDEEQGGSAAPTSIQQHHHDDEAPSVETDDLTLFRLMVGISTPPHLSSGHKSSIKRPADNIGLYARVVHSEQTSKDNYKVFSAVINACYFLQIIIAAALTALGAANADNKAITAFGAINTVIAGLLTYLKGSGLPGRLKYFGNEWKKIREYIEQRERDFSYPGCRLDVYEVVEHIREMYANTKRDVEMNSPEAYNSVTRSMNSHSNPAAAAAHNNIPGIHINATAGIDPQKVDDVAAKIRSMEDTIRKLRGKLDKTGQDIIDEEKRVVSDLRQYGKDVVDTAHAVQDEEKRTTAELRSYGKAVLASFDDRPRHPREVSYGGTDESRTVVEDTGTGGRR